MYLNLNGDLNQSDRLLGISMKILDVLHCTQINVLTHREENIQLCVNSV